MAPRTVYANLTDGLNPLSLWDTSLADMGSLGITPCTAVGTNSIVLTPISSVFAPTVTNPHSLQAFSFVAAATSTGSVTVTVGSSGALKLYRMDGVTQAAANDILINVTYLINYNAALNSSAGGFQIIGPISNEINPVISGATISGSTLTTCTYNGNTWTAGTGTLTIAASKTLTASNTLTLAGTDSTTITFQGTDTYIGRATTDTLTNKTYDTAGTGNSFKINGTAITATTGSGSVALATSPALTTPSIDVATGTSLAVTGLISSSGTAGIGYATGAGGTVTQITSHTTAVTLNKISGTITVFTATGTNVPNSFTVNNSLVAATDTIVLSVKSATNTYLVYVSSVAAGSFQITFQAQVGTASDGPLINFAVIKAVAS